MEQKLVGNKTRDIPKMLLNDTQSELLFIQTLPLYIHALEKYGAYQAEAGEYRAKE